MPKIVVKRKAEVYKEFPIRPFQSKIRIGSEGDNDLIIADKKVSMHHLVIEKEGTNYFLKDTLSAFGTFLNGTKIADRTLLSSGDEIALGEHTLIFENVLFETKNEDNGEMESTSEKSDDISNTLVGEIVESDIPIASKKVEIATDTGLTRTETRKQEVPASLKPFYLLTIYGPYTGKKYHLNRNGDTKIGRDRTLNDIVIRENSKGAVDTSISRRHATIFIENDQFFIMDKRSKTRTRVNQQQLNEEDIVQLKENDELEIVSDQQSTIFRVITEGNTDFSSPKKAGDWWIRNSAKVIQASSIAAIALIILFLINIISKMSLINQSPEQLTVTEKSYFAGKNRQSMLFQPSEILTIVPSLAPALADLNTDNFLDLIYLDKVGYLNVINGKTKSELFNNKNSLRVQLPLGVVIADLNNNKVPDILVPGNNSILYAIDGNSGTEIWTSPILGGLFSGNPVVADLNGDGFSDILICSQNGQIHVAFGSYNEPDWSTIQTESEIKCGPSAGDLDNDGIAEVAIGTEDGKVLIYDGQKNNLSHVIDINEELQKAKGSFFENHSIRQRVAIGKINANEYDDLVILTDQNNIIAFDGDQFKRLWFDEMEIEPDEGAQQFPPVLSDLNGDGALDIVIATNDNKIVSYDGIGNGNGQKKILWGFIPETMEQFVSNPVIADVNKDNFNDVIIPGFYDGLYIFNGQTGKLMSELSSIDDNQNALIATPLIADVMHDNYIDILIRKNNDSFSVLQTNSKVKLNSVLWGQINNGPLQSGVALVNNQSTMIYYILIFLSIIFIFLLIGYNIFSPIKRKKLFFKPIDI